MLIRGRCVCRVVVTRPAPFQKYVFMIGLAAGIPLEVGPDSQNTISRVQGLDLKQGIIRPL
jgi:hypothetical protein